MSVAFVFVSGAVLVRVTTCQAGTISQVRRDKLPQTCKNLPTWTLSYVFMIGRSAASEIISLRPLGGPENASNLGDNPNINNVV